MRPLFFLLGLAFVAIVLIADIDAIVCYLEDPKQHIARQEVDCSRAIFPHGAVSNGQCYRYDSTWGTAWGCGFAVMGVNFCHFDGVQCCNTDLCNGDLPSKEVPPPSAPLKCYKEMFNVSYSKVDCDEEERLDGVPSGMYTECATAEGTSTQGKKATVRHVTFMGCWAGGADCNELDLGPDITIHCTRCGNDYCNSPAATCTPAVPLIIAIVASSIAALGF